MTTKVPISESGTATLGMMVAERLRRKRKITITTSAMVSMSSNSTSRTEARMVLVRSVRTVSFTAAGSVAWSLGSSSSMARDHLNGIGAGLALDVDNDRRGFVHPGGKLGVFDTVAHPGYIGEHDGGAVFVGDDEVAIAGAREQLVIGIDLEILCRAVEAALGGVHAFGGERIAQVFKIDAVGSQRRGVGLYADSGLLSAADGDQADAAELRNLGSEAGVDQVFDARERHGFGGEREGEDGRVGGIRFAVDGRDGKVGRQVALRGVDGRLHFLLGDVDVEVQGKLQHDDGAAVGAGGGHLREPGYLAELALERRGDGGRHDLRAGPGIEGLHLDGGVIRFRQRGDGQGGVGGQSDDQDRDHQECGCDRPKYEGARRIQRVCPGGTLSGQSACGIAIAGDRSLRRFLDLHLGAVLQFVKAGERDGVARVEAFDRGDVAVGGLLDNVLDGGSVVA